MEQALKKLLNKHIQPDEWLVGDQIKLRLATLSDCTEQYVAWLKDSRINQFLETRWSEQTLHSIKEFVSSMLDDPSNYLFAIIEQSTNRHIGNIKIGPINQHHSYADVSYFIGEPSCWGKGYATEAITLVTQFGFDVLKLHRLQAGLYEGNIGSQRALEKSGYHVEAIFKKQLKFKGQFIDHIWLANMRDSTTEVTS